MRLIRSMTTACCLTLAVTCGTLFTAAEARAAAGDFTYSTGSGTPQNWVGFGDSIMAGYCGLFCSIKSYASYYADSAAAENGWAVNLDANPQSGETTIQIYDEMLNGHLGALQNADLVIWSAGGNDFLNARDDYAASCNVAALDQAMLNWQADWDLIISLVSTDAKPEARIRTMNVYYPDPDQDRANFCGATSDFEVFFPRLLDAGEYMCSTAAAAGFLCADSIGAMNCDEIDASHTIDPNCLDPSGSNFRDPLNVVKYVNGVPTSWPSASNSGMIQGDRTHPGAVGQQYIAAAHHELGYADDSGSVCGDGTCDVDETAATCPADCPDVCGDGLCTGAETTGTCPADCGTSCGDGTCNGSESTATCPADCGTFCGDGVCNGLESTATCPADCGTSCGDGTCNGAENTTDCPADCGTFCGDGVCNGDETEANCADDCASTCVPAGQGQPCEATTDCCSGVGNCTGGKPANRVCAQASSGSVCGDLIVEGEEQCEAGVPLADSCTSLGFTSGTLACDEATCQYDTSGCSGGGTCAGNKEACTVNSDCCSNNCKSGSCKGG